MVSATNTAASVGKVMAVVFAVAAMFWSPMLLLIAVFVWIQGESERIRVVEEARAEQAGFRSWPWTAAAFPQSPRVKQEQRRAVFSGQPRVDPPEWEVLPPEADTSHRRYHYRVVR
jgi:hypothetical protein